MSAITIAKYETKKVPGQATLQRLALLAAESGLDEEARLLRSEAVAADPSSPETRRQFLLNAAFHKFVEAADGKRRQQLERVLSKELHQLQDQFKDYWSPSDEAIPAHSGTLFSLAKPADQSHHVASFETNLQPLPEANPELEAAAWLLEVEEERKSLRRYLVDAIARVIGQREAELTEEEQRRLRELGEEAIARVAQERERDKRAADLSVPAAIKGFRNELALTEREFAYKIGVSTNELADCESGVRGPSPRILGRMIDLYQGDFDQRSAEYQVLLSAIRKRFVSGSLHAAAGASETFSGGVGWRTYDAMFQIIKDLTREKNELRRLLAEYALPGTPPKRGEKNPERFRP